MEFPIFSWTIFELTMTLKAAFCFGLIFLGMTSLALPRPSAQIFFPDEDEPPVEDMIPIRPPIRPNAEIKADKEVRNEMTFYQTLRLNFLLSSGAGSWFVSLSRRGWRRPKLRRGRFRGSRKTAWDWRVGRRYRRIRGWFRKVGRRPRRIRG